MNKQDLVQKIEENGGEYFKDGIRFSFNAHDTNPEEKKYSIHAIVSIDNETFEFNLWSHYEDRVDELYTNVSLKNVNQLIGAVQKLEVFFGENYLKIESLKPIEIQKNIYQDSPETFLAKGKIEAMEFIFNSHNKITLEK